MFSSSFAVISCHCQQSEFPADPFFAGRPSQAAATLAVSRLQLTGRSNNSVAAVAETFPEYLPCGRPFRHHTLDKQFPKALSGQVFISCPYPFSLCGEFTCRISAGFCPSLFQGAGIDFNCSSAVARALPHYISVLPSGRRLHGCQIAESAAGKVAVPAHSRTSNAFSDAFTGRCKKRLSTRHGRSSQAT